MMLFRFALIICLLSPGAATAQEKFLSSIVNTPRYSLVALSYGQDFYYLNKNGDSYRELTLLAGRFPTASGLGWHAYLMAARYTNGSNARRNMWTLGSEAIYSRQISTSSFFIYGGLGLAYTNQETPATGTLWNFSMSAGVRYRPGNSVWFVDLNCRHLSHGSKLGIEPEKENSGINIIGLQAGIIF